MLYSPFTYPVLIWMPRQRPRRMVGVLLLGVGLTHVASQMSLEVPWPGLAGPHWYVVWLHTKVGASVGVGVGLDVGPTLEVGPGLEVGFCVGEQDSSHSCKDVPFPGAAISHVFVVSLQL
jgi:hypothetical protein